MRQWPPPRTKVLLPYLKLDSDKSYYSGIYGHYPGTYRQFTLEPWGGEYRKYLILTALPDNHNDLYAFAPRYRNYSESELRKLSNSTAIEAELITLANSIKHTHYLKSAYVVEIDLVSLEDEGYAYLIERVLGAPDDFKFNPCLFATASKTMFNRYSLGMGLLDNEPVFWTPKMSPREVVIARRLMQSLRLLETTRTVDRSVLLPKKETTNDN